MTRLRASPPLCVRWARVPVCAALILPLGAAAVDASPQAQDQSVVALPAAAGAPEAQIPDGKRMAATRTSAAPVIDGLVDEAVWEAAEVVGDFFQRNPDNGEPASERTEVRILYDDEYIYVGFIMFDREPDRIVARERRRDARMRDEDTIAVVFDTFHDHRNGFLFRLNPLGTQHDSSFKNETQINTSWDEKWEGAAHITELGWEAEMAIPFKALRYRAGTHVWGVDFKREIARRIEESDWSNYRRGFTLNIMSEAGHLVGLENLQLTQRFRFKPYVTAGGEQVDQTLTPTTEGTGNIGVEDFKIQITPNLTADLTVNTDFAHVEDDAERVNLTRFPLYFPEKREFFLESANSFAFPSSAAIGGRGPSVSLYHSRRIGLKNGEPVRLTYGAKMTGKIGPTSVGLLNAQTGDSEFGPGENYTAVRLRQDVFGRSTIGGIFTNVQGGGNFNRVAGVDGSFRFLNYLSISGYVASMDDSEVVDNPIVGRFGAGWRSDQFNLSGSYEFVDPEFKSDLGYIRRRDIAQQRYGAGWSPRPSWSLVRQFRFNTSLTYLTDAEGRLLTRDQGASFTAGFESGDIFTATWTRNFERLDYPFYVLEGVIIPPGDYSFDTWSTSFNTYSARPASMRFRVSGGGYFNGTRTSVSPSATFRFGATFSLSPGYSFNRLEVPGGSSDTHVVSLRSSLNFSREWLTNWLVQYNSVSGEMSVFARLNYIYRTGDDFFVVYTQTRMFDGIFVGQSNRTLVAKLTYSFDF